MEKNNNGKAKVVSSTSNSYNIQPRVVLQRLSKDYTFGVASGSDNQPSTSGYLSNNNKRPEVDSSVSGDTSDNLNTGDDSSVTPSTSKPTNSRFNFRGEKIIEFRVAELQEGDLKDIDLIRKRFHHDTSSGCGSGCRPASVSGPGSGPGSPPDSGSSSGSECSYHSSPKEVVVVEDRTESEESDACSDCDADKFDKPTTPESSGSEENSVRELSRTEAKIQKAISFLKLLVDTYGRRLENTIEIEQPSTSASAPSPSPNPSPSPAQARRPVNRQIVLRPQRNSLKDCLVRVWLPIRGQKKKKKFHVRLSQLISLLKDKHHPLHKFRHTLNLRTLRFLSDNELRVIARVLSDFVCAKRVRF